MGSSFQPLHEVRAALRPGIWGRVIILSLGILLNSLPQEISKHWSCQAWTSFVLFRLERASPNRTSSHTVGQGGRNEGTHRLAQSHLGLEGRNKVSEGLEEGTWNLALMTKSLCVCILPVYMCNSYMLDAGGQKRMSDALERELWMTMSCPCGCWELNPSTLQSNKCF